MDYLKEGSKIAWVRFGLHSVSKNPRTNFEPPNHPYHRTTSCKKSSEPPPTPKPTSKRPSSPRPTFRGTKRSASSAASSGLASSLLPPPALVVPPWTPSAQPWKPRWNTGRERGTWFSCSTGSSASSRTEPSRRGPAPVFGTASPTELLRWPRLSVCLAVSPRSSFSMVGRAFWWIYLTFLASTNNRPTVRARFTTFPGKISKKGVLAPMTRDLWEPLLKGCEAEKIGMTDEIL